MITFNTGDGNPPFDTWLFLDLGRYLTFGRIKKRSPNDDDPRSEYDEFKNTDNYQYYDYQFFIQDMTTLDSVSDHDDYFSEFDYLTVYSDSIESWALMESEK